MSVKVRFVNEVEIKEGKKLIKSAKEAGIKIDDSCSGKGKCGKCIVRIHARKLSDPTDEEIKTLGQDKIDNGYRLSCQIEILEDAVIEIINTDKKEKKSKK